MCMYVCVYALPMHAPCANPALLLQPRQGSVDAQTNDLSRGAAKLDARQRQDARAKSALVKSQDPEVG